MQYLAGLTHSLLFGFQKLDAFGPFPAPLSSHQAQLGAVVNRNKANTCTLR